MHTHTVRRSALGLTLVLSLAAPGQAQSTVRPIPRVPLPGAAGALSAVPRASWTQLDEVAPEADERTTVEAELFGTYLGTADLSDLPGSVQTVRGGLSATIGREFGPFDRAALELRSESNFYDFDAGTDLVPGAPDPFNDVYDTRLIGSHYHAVGERSSLFTGAELRFAGEDEAELTEGLTLSGTVGIGYRPSRELEVRFGLLGFSRLEDDGVAIPYVGLDWQPSDTLRLTAEGTRVELGLLLAERWDLVFGAEYEQRQFRLNDDAPNLNAAFRDEQVDVEAQLGFELREGTRLAATAGVALWRELTFLADGGDLLSVTEVDPEPYVGLTLEIGI